MSLYVCDYCGAIENTVQGSYYLTDMGRSNEKYGIEESVLLCHRCCPTHKPDGSVIEHSTHPYGQYTGRITPELWDGRIGALNRISKDKYIQCMELLQLYFYKNTSFSEKITKPQARMAFEMIENYNKQQFMATLLLKENGGERKIIGEAYNRLRKLVASSKDLNGSIKIFASHSVDLRK